MWRFLCLCTTGGLLMFMLLGTVVILIPSTLPSTLPPTPVLTSPLCIHNETVTCGFVSCYIRSPYMCS